MDEHHCLLCMGSNTNRYAQLSVAREALRTTFPDIHFSGRIPEDKAQGVVKLDIDLLVFDNKILKPEDMEREYIRRGMSVLF